MLKEICNLAILTPAASTVWDITWMRLQKALLKTGVLQNALKSTNFSSIITDENGVIQIFNAGTERMLGDEVIARAKALRIRLESLISSDCEALHTSASRSIKDIYEKTCTRKDGGRLMAIVSVTTLRDALNAIVGYLLIGTYNTVRKQTDKVLLKKEVLKSTIFQQHRFLDGGFNLVMAGSTSPTAISPKGAAGYSRPAATWQRHLCCAGK